MDFTRLEINRRTALMTSAAIAAAVIHPMRAFAQGLLRKGAHRVDDSSGNRSRRHQRGTAINLQACEIHRSLLGVAFTGRPFQGTAVHIAGRYDTIADGVIS